MKLQIVKIGKPAYKEYESLVKVFQQRLNVMTPIEAIEIKATQGIEKSEKTLWSALKWSEDRGGKSAGHITVGLDERGQALTSPQLAQKLSDWQGDPAVKSVTFVIGGPYGLSPSFKKQADLLWSLSPLVMPSDMAWLMVWEQVYRGFSILKGSSYHHE